MAGPVSATTRACWPPTWRSFLGLVNDKEAVLVGVGNLGMALALYPGFERYGLRIIALFDSDPAKLGDLPDGRQVLPVEKLTDLVERLQVRIGIITAPEAVAQEVADAMVAGGIAGDLEFCVVQAEGAGRCAGEKRRPGRRAGDLIASHLTAQDRRRAAGSERCNELVYGVWEGKVIDPAERRRDLGLSQIEKLGEYEPGNPIRAMMGWDGFLLFAEPAAGRRRGR